MPSSPVPQRLVILGAGAVGGAIGGLVHAAGAPVVLIARGAHGAHIRSRGLTLRLPGRTLCAPIPCVPAISDLSIQAGDIVLLTTKLGDAQAALDELRSCAGPDVPVVCAVNGIDAEPWAAARFNTVAAMFVWIPAVHLVPGEVAIYGAPCPAVLDLGPYPNADAAAPWSESLAQLLRRAGFDSVIRPDIQRWKRAKWVTNLGGAAQALVKDDWRSVARAARAEGEAVLDAAGLDRCGQEDLLQRTRLVRPSMIDGQGRPGGSTWQSRARGKPLESRWIEGAMVRLARRVGVDVPVLQLLTAAAEDPRTLTAAEVLGQGAGARDP